MSSYKKKVDLFATENGLAIEKVLRLMEEDPKYSTKPTYSANSEQYPDNLIPFVDRHMQYLRHHPATDPQQYVANLQLMTRVR